MNFKTFIKKKLKEAKSKKAPEYITAKYKGKTLKDFSIVDVQITYVGRQSWWMTWFSHTSLSKFDSE